MAFMMPVVKNDYDIYKSNRTRRNSECSSSTTSNPSCRSRKVSESKSYGPSLSTSPGSDNSYAVNGISPAHRNFSHTGAMPSRQYSQQQMSSRNSASSLQSPDTSQPRNPKGRHVRTFSGTWFKQRFFKT